MCDQMVEQFVILRETFATFLAYKGLLLSMRESVSFKLGRRDKTLSACLKDEKMRYNIAIILQTKM